MTYLPDVNVWVALAVAEHVHHAPAMSWIQESTADTVAFCRVTQMGFLRLLANARVMGGDELSAARAWSLLDSFYQDAGIVFIEEPVGVDARWRVLTQHSQAGKNMWTDAYLAAFAGTAGCTLVTFDGGFRRQKEARVRLLS
jgi:toxin-antitoxin system PIN domain toxin